MKSKELIVSIYVQKEEEFETILKLIECDDEKKPFKIDKYLLNKDSESLNYSINVIFLNKKILYSTILYKNILSIKNNILIFSEKKTQEFYSKYLPKLKTSLLLSEINKRLFTEYLRLLVNSEKKQRKIERLENKIAKETQFLDLLESINIGTYVTNIEGDLLKVNKAFCDILGYSEKEICLMGAHELYSDARLRDEFIIENSKKNYVENLESALISKDGKEVNILESSRSVKDKSGNIICFEGIIQDVTESKIKNEELILLSKALDEAANGIVITDIDGRILWVNKSFTSMTGYEISEIKKKDTRILKSGLHNNYFYKTMWETILEGKVWSGEIYNKKKDGEIVLEEMTITPLVIDNEIKNFVAIKHDITQRKDYETALKESEERLRRIFDNTSLGIFRISYNGKILLGNKAFVNMLGYKAFHEIALSNVAPSFFEKNNYKKIFDLVSSSKEVLGAEIKLFKKSKNRIVCRVNSKKVFDKNNKLQFIDCTLEEITKFKKAQEELKTAKAEAESSDTLKTEFLSVISHELRTPLNSLLSYSRILRDDLYQYFDDDLKNISDIIEQSGDRILRTINMTTNMVEIQSDNYKFNPETLDIYEDVFAKIMTDFEAKALDKGIDFFVDLSTGNTIIEGVDERSVKQIMIQLIDNAVKFTDEGEIVVRFSRQNNLLQFEISDTGLGIDEKYKNNLFSFFSQEKTVYTRPLNGNGLGLSIVKRYCEINNAAIEVESEFGFGSTFRITFNN